MRMDALGDTRQRRRFLHELLDTSRGILRVARGFKQRPGCAIPQIRPAFVGEVGQQRDIALLATLGMRDQQHLLVKIHIGDLQVHKLGHACAGLEQRLDEQAPHARHTIGLSNQALLFGTGETGNHALARGRPCNGEGAPHFLGHVPRLIIREVMPPPQFEGVRDDRVETI